MRVLLAVILLIVTAVGANADEPIEKAEKQQAKAEAQLRNLLQQKLKLAERQLKRMEKLHKQQIVSDAELERAEREVLEARLLLEDAPVRQIHYLKELIVRARKHEERLRRLHEDGLVSEQKVSQAELDRLDLEILLARLRAE